MNKSILFFILITFSVPLHAQLPRMEIEGSSTITGESFPERRDINGRLCAAIKVVSDMEGFVYDAYNGVVGDVVDKPSVDLVYLSPDERVLLIFHTGYEPLKIILSEIDIQLKEKQMWAIRIKGGVSGILPVSFITNPAGAQIVIDGKNMGKGTTFQLILGSHRITLSKEMYRTIEDTISVDPKHTLFTYTLVIIPEMVYVEGGTFDMGSNEGNDDEKPIHRVTLTSFYIGKYEITQKEWVQVMGSNPSYFQGDSLPVEGISWYDAVEFCNKISESSGIKPCYIINKNRKDPNNKNESDNVKWLVTCDFRANGYRLPTEAEWEYSCRGGSRSLHYLYSGSNNVAEVAWYFHNSGSKNHPVGEKKPNELGIYDMSGNVSEWCWDWFSYYVTGTYNDPLGTSYGLGRVRRSKGRYAFAKCMRCAYRFAFWADGRNSRQGLRLCRSYFENEQSKK